MKVAGWGLTPATTKTHPSDKYVVLFKLDRRAGVFGDPSVEESL